MGQARGRGVYKARASFVLTAPVGRRYRVPLEGPIPGGRRVSMAGILCAVIEQGSSGHARDFGASLSHDYSGPISTRDELGTLLPNPRWIRGFVDGRLVVDSRDVLGVWDHRHYPSWYFPIHDVHATLEPTGEIRNHSGVGEVEVHNVIVGARLLAGSALQPTQSAPPELRHRVRIDFHAVDRWFEEDIEVFSEPRNPYVRVDALPSSRHVKVIHNGAVIADTTKPVLLFETGVATRYYVPAVHVRLEFLTATSKTTSCPYKGFASYYSITVDDDQLADAAWTYTTPFRSAAPVAGMLCFYTNRLLVEVDGLRVTT